MAFDARPPARRRSGPAGWLAVAGGIALIAAALWWGPSAALRYALDRSFASLGYRVVALGEVAVSLVERRVSVAGVDLQPPGGGRVRLDLADLRVAPSALLSGRLFVPRARIAGLAIEVAQARDGTFRVAGLPLVAGGTGSTAERALAIGISDFELDGARIALRAGDARVEVVIARFAIDDLPFGDPGARPRFEFAASVDGRPLRLSGTVAPFASAPAGRVRLETDGLALAPLARLAGLDLAGTLDARLDLRLETDGTAGVDGTLALKAPSGFGAAAASLDWRGNATRHSGGRVDGKATLGIENLRHTAGGIDAGASALSYEGAFSHVPAGAAALEGTLTLAGAKLSAAPIDALSLDTLRVDTRRLTYSSDRVVAGPLTLEARGLAASGGGAALAAATILGQGTLSAGPLAQVFDGVVEIAGASVERPGERYAAGRIGVESVSFGRTPDAGSLRGAVAIDALAARTPDIDLAVAQARYAGTIELAAAGPVASGRLTAAKLRAGLPAAEIVATLDAAEYDGSLALAAAPVAEGKVRADAISLVDATAREIFAASRIDLTDFSFGAAGASALRVALAEPRVLRRERARPGREAFGWRIEAPRAVFEDARVSAAGGIAVNTARIEQPTLRLTRTRNGFLSFERGAPPAAGAPAAPSPGLSVGRFQIVEGRAAFEDRTPHDTVRVPMSALTLTLADLDDRRPERPTTFSFEARVGAFGGARASGAVFPFAPRLSFDVEFAADAIDLPPISAYADQALGVDVRTGTASVEGRIAARDAALDGRTKWRIANARLDERETGAGELAAQAGAPVGLALSLLADADNNIELEIPVAGNLDNPSFDTGDAVRQAVGGALRGALTGTLGVLFPFGSLISGIVDDERRGKGIKLPDVAFAAGAGTLEPKAGEALDAVARLLAARPAARLEVCGFAGPADAGGRSPDEEVLRALAAARTETVKRRLVEDGRVAATRVFECRPVVETGRDALPRAELRF